MFMNYKEEAIKKHKELQGKISVGLKAPVENPEELAIYYTPGVGAVSKLISENEDETPDYTWTNNSVAVVSDGSSVLGLGDIGPKASLPVMEGKAMLFKHFAGIDAVPIVLDVHSADEIVDTVKAIAPGFGGINLEDIAAPLCFEIEERLKDELSIPVMHDDQHGTAIVVLAGLINASTVTSLELNSSIIAVNGVGAAGVAIMRLVKRYAPDCQIIAVDSKGIIGKSREDLNPTKQKLIDDSIIVSDKQGNLDQAVAGANIFLGVSRGNVLNSGHIKSMANKPIVFAMANPDPEILPNEALSAGALVVATGRSDFPNQVNNALVFPGVFRGALDNRVKRITTAHKIAAAEAVASLIESPSADEIIPSVFDDRLVPTIAKTIV